MDENEQWQSDLEAALKVIMAFKHYIDKVDADNQRLREAFKAILGTEHIESESEAAAICLDIAHDALKGDTE